MTAGPRNVVLVGFMGAGKSAVGRALAARLGRPFVDTDEVVERRAGRPIPAIFAAEGEAAFRALERAAVACVAGRAGQVVATGGGTVADAANLAALRATGLVVYLAARPETLAARVAGSGDRPLLLGAADAAARVRELLARREAAYRAADAVIETDGLAVPAVVDAVLELARSRGLAQVEAAARVEVALGERSYPVLIGPGLADRVGAAVRERLPKARRAALVTNPVVGRLYGGRVAASLAAADLEPLRLEVPDGERYKTLATAARLLDRLAAARLDRASPVVALGGGVVGDLAGFVAATWLRGVPLVHVPTTLLAQVDSAIGGKTGVNHRRGKNLIGAFHQPVLVASDIGTLASLPEREYRAGLAEVVKYGLIRDAALFAFLEREADGVLAREPAAVTYLVRRSVEIKAEVVAADEREGGLRAVLNFGHTLGHAVEALTGYARYLHGEAVAMGMAAAVRMSEGLLRDDPDARERVARVLARYGLPTEPPRLARGRLAGALAGDKKARSSAAEPTVTVVLLDRIGRATLEPMGLGELLSRLGFGSDPEGGSSWGVRGVASWSSTRGPSSRRSSSAAVRARSTTRPTSRR